MVLFHTKMHIANLSRENEYKISSWKLCDCSFWQKTMPTVCGLLYIYPEKWLQLYCIMLPCYIPMQNEKGAQYQNIEDRNGLLVVVCKRSSKDNNKRGHRRRGSFGSPYQGAEDLVADNDSTENRILNAELSIPWNRWIRLFSLRGGQQWRQGVKVIHFSWVC